MIREEVKSEVVSLENLKEELDDLKGEAILPDIIKHFEDTGYLSLLDFMFAFG